MLWEFRKGKDHWGKLERFKLLNPSCSHSKLFFEKLPGLHVLGVRYTAKAHWLSNNSCTYHWKWVLPMSPSGTKRKPEWAHWTNDRFSQNVEKPHIFISLCILLQVNTSFSGGLDDKDSSEYIICRCFWRLKFTLIKPVYYIWGTTGSLQPILGILYQGMCS